MSILLIDGSPTEHSRTAVLLDGIEQRVRTLVGDRQLHVDRLRIRDLSQQALLLADWWHPSLVRAFERVANARAVVIATPVHNIASNELLKAFFSLLPQIALKGKSVLPVATTSSPHHSLTLECALQSLLQTLGTQKILPGVYASDHQIPRDENGEDFIAGEVSRHLDDATHMLLHEGLRVSPMRMFPSAPFSQPRCSA